MMLERIQLSILEDARLRQKRAQGKNCYEMGDYGVCGPSFHMGSFLCETMPMHRFQIVSVARP